MPKPTEAQLEEFHQLSVLGYFYQTTIEQVTATANRLELNGERAKNESKYPVEFINAVNETIKQQQKLAKKQLTAEYRTIVPQELQDWQEETRGMGELMFARILGVVGHPCWMLPKEWDGDVLVSCGLQPRAVGQLWSYMGHGDPERRHKKGQSQDEAMACGHSMGKMLVHLQAESFIKAKNPHYREVYDSEKERTQDIHGEEWTKGHHANSALRVVGKTWLKDLWIRSQDL